MMFGAYAVSEFWRSQFVRMDFGECGAVSVGGTAPFEIYIFSVVLKSQSAFPLRGRMFTIADFEV